MTSGRHADCHSEAKPKNLDSHFAKSGEMGALSTVTVFSNAAVEILRFTSLHSDMSLSEVKE